MNRHFITKSAELVKASGTTAGFVSAFSHNLRSPLTSIEGLVSIAGCLPDRNEVSRYLNMIQHCALNLLQMLHNIEEYTRMQDREIKKNSINAQELVERVVYEYRKEIDEKQIAVTVNISQSFSWGSDEHCNYLILKHLVGNALYFNDGEKKLKRISIKLDVTLEEVTIEVSDNGIGIAEGEKEKIFDPFYRSSNQSKGSGLGLFLVRSAVDKLDASIEVHTTEKVGSSFRIAMPNY